MHFHGETLVNVLRFRFVLVCAIAVATTAASLVATAPAPVVPRNNAATATPGLMPQPARAAAVPRLELPNDKNSLKFVVLGDFGTGSSDQYRLAERMATVHERFPFELVVLVGDNIYGSDRPQDFKRKFEDPYKPLLDAGVKFYAALGNHDAREQRFYKLFNMDGHLFYSFKAPKQDVRFFALESTYMEPKQLDWLGKQLENTRERWKIVFQHHPLYSSGRTHGSNEGLRKTLEPMFTAHGVDLVLTGHDHIYERMKPQHGILHFVAGSGGKLRKDGARPGLSFSARIVDDTNVFLALEILDDRLVFNAIATDGRIVDAGQFARVETTGQPAPSPGAVP